MKTAKERIHWINEVAQQDFDRAQGMLDMLNDVFGTDFRFLAKRVVASDMPGSSVADFYASCHDLEAAMEHDERKQHEDAVRHARETIEYHEKMLASLEEAEDSLAKRSYTRHHRRQIEKAKAFLESVGAK